MNWEDIFNYNSETGELKWKIQPADHIYPGVVAGTLTRNGYLQIKYKRKAYLAHRIALGMILGRELLSKEKVDHINGITTDNRKSNLRLAVGTGNECNRKLSRANKSGYKGICTYADTRTGTKMWSAAVKKDHVTHRKYFPYTDTGLDLAIKWVASTRLTYHGEFANNGYRT